MSAWQDAIGRNWVEFERKAEVADLIFRTSMVIMRVCMSKPTPKTADISTWNDTTPIVPTRRTISGRACLAGNQSTEIPVFITSLPNLPVHLRSLTKVQVCLMAMGREKVRARIREAQVRRTIEMTDLDRALWDKGKQLGHVRIDYPRQPS